MRLKILSVLLIIIINVTSAQNTYALSTIPDNPNEALQVITQTVASLFIAFIQKFCKNGSSANYNLESTGGNVIEPYWSQIERNRYLSPNLPQNQQPFSQLTNKRRSDEADFKIDTGGNELEPYLYQSERKQYLPVDQPQNPWPIYQKKSFSTNKPGCSFNNPNFVDNEDELNGKRRLFDNSDVINPYANIFLENRKIRSFDYNPPININENRDNINPSLNLNYFRKNEEQSWSNLLPKVGNNILDNINPSLTSNNFPNNQKWSWRDLLPDFELEKSDNISPSSNPNDLDKNTEQNWLPDLVPKSFNSLDNLFDRLQPKLNSTDKSNTKSKRQEENNLTNKLPILFLREQEANSVTTNPNINQQNQPYYSQHVPFDSYLPNQLLLQKPVINKHIPILYKNKPQIDQYQIPSNNRLTSNHPESEQFETFVPYESSINFQQETESTSHELQPQNNQYQEINLPKIERDELMPNYLQGEQFKDFIPNEFLTNMQIETEAKSDHVQPTKQSLTDQNQYIYVSQEDNNQNEIPQIPDQNQPQDDQYTTKQHPIEVMPIPNQNQVQYPDVNIYKNLIPNYFQKIPDYYHIQLLNQQYDRVIPNEIDVKNDASIPNEFNQSQYQNFPTKSGQNQPVAIISKINQIQPHTTFILKYPRFNIHIAKQVPMMNYQPYRLPAFDLRQSTSTPKPIINYNYKESNSKYYVPTGFTPKLIHKKIDLLQTMPTSLVKESISNHTTNNDTFFPETTPQSDVKNQFVQTQPIVINQVSTQPDTYTSTPISTHSESVPNVEEMYPNLENNEKFQKGVLLLDFHQKYMPGYKDLLENSIISFIDKPLSQFTSEDQKLFSTLIKLGNSPDKLNAKVKQIMKAHPDLKNLQMKIPDEVLKSNQFQQGLIMLKDIPASGRKLQDVFPMIMGKIFGKDPKYYSPLEQNIFSILLYLIRNPAKLDKYYEDVKWNQQILDLPNELTLEDKFRRGVILFQLYSQMEPLTHNSMDQLIQLVMRKSLSNFSNAEKQLYVNLKQLGAQPYQLNKHYVDIQKDQTVPKDQMHANNVYQIGIILIKLNSTFWPPRDVMGQLITKVIKKHPLNLNRAEQGIIAELSRLLGNPSKINEEFERLFEHSLSADKQVLFAIVKIPTNSSNADAAKQILSTLAEDLRHTMTGNNKTQGDSTVLIVSGADGSHQVNLANNSIFHNNIHSFLNVGTNHTEMTELLNALEKYTGSEQSQDVNDIKEILMDKDSIAFKEYFSDNSPAKKQLLHMLLNALDSNQTENALELLSEWFNSKKLPTTTKTAPKLPSYDKYNNVQRRVIIEDFEENDDDEDEDSAIDFNMPSTTPTIIRRKRSDQPKSKEEIKNDVDGEDDDENWNSDETTEHFPSSPYDFYKPNQTESEEESMAVLRFFYRFVGKRMSRYAKEVYMNDLNKGIPAVKMTKQPPYNKSHKKATNLMNFLNRSYLEH